VSINLLGEHVGLVGPNGVGKSTLLRCLVGGERPDAGTIVRSPPGLRVGYLAQSFDQWRERTVGQVLSAALGEWQVAAVRDGLGLAMLLLQAPEVLLLDEPLNHLDVEGREHFEAALSAFPGTVIAVAHDRAFLRGFAQRIVEVRAGKVRVVEGGYLDYLREVRGSVGSEY